MMNFYLYVIFAVLLVIGLIKTIWVSRTESINLEFGNKYLQTYQDFVRAYRDNTKNGSLYTWLTKNSVKMQNQLGLFGIFDYQPAYSNYMIRNYQILVNALPEFRTGFVHDADIGAIEDSLIRYLGFLEDVVTNNRKNLYNPIAWFREGIQAALATPLYLLEYLGVSKSGSSKYVSQTKLFQLISGILSLITLVASIISIFSDWETVMKLFNAGQKISP